MYIATSAKESGMLYLLADILIDCMGNVGSSSTIIFWEVVGGRAAPPPVL